ncbi:MAG TPA: DUF5666 domain-containing protein [Vicinamibacterales bacterium]|jgi:hypothetical protein|nr:DUF5666 domain-containing protein [Vicinamibacterales bacterium]
MTVSVVGAPQTVEVDDANHFALSNVAPGHVTLRFLGQGVSGTIALTDVGTDDSVMLGVMVANGGVSLASETHGNPNEPQDQLEGRITATPPVTAALTLRVDDQTVTTTSSTIYTMNGASSSFAALAAGQRVHVKGTMAGSAFTAASIDIENTDVTVPIDVAGTISGVSGSASTFQFNVGTTAVHGDSTTAFDNNKTFANLSNGVGVDVHGTQKNGFVLATSVHID